MNNCLSKTAKKVGESFEEEEAEEEEEEEEEADKREKEREEDRLGRGMRASYPHDVND